MNCRDVETRGFVGLGRGNESARPVDGEVLDCMERLYVDLEKKLGNALGRCRMDGACCRFSESGIRLFVTPLEISYLLKEPSPSPPASEGVAGNCPFQSGGLCGVRERRPLGCRIYFCASSGEEERSKLYEEFHRKIRRLHERHGILYSYRELTESISC